MKTYNLNIYPDADYTPNDVGPAEVSQVWDEFEDQEVNRLLETEDNCPL